MRCTVWPKVVNQPRGDGMRKVIGLTLALAAGFGSAVAADPTPKEQQPGETN
jgi:hypothetical protein